jgi:pyrimidine-nucleoside phosphorylase
MRTVDIIGRKRDGHELTPEEIAYFVQGVTDGTIPDYQASAFLMAVCVRGMTTAETVALTRAMLASGATLGAPRDSSGSGGYLIDKHSTGGVGDKTSLILAPLGAAMGMRVPMLAGRALGHTGGTLDKLECIPGFRTDLSEHEALAQLRDVRAFITGTTAEIAPADRKLYALRDVTATVESIPLITASILSKKLAENVQGLVLDVKAGSGAFMKDTESARMLARSLVDTARAMGVTTVALITDMDQPLGRTVGNALETKECITAMRGKMAPDLEELTITLAAWMLNINDTLAEDRTLTRFNEFARKAYWHEVMEYFEKGDALKAFIQMVDAQGGDVEAVMNPSRIPVAANVEAVAAPATGYIKRVRAAEIGAAARMIGAGRLKADDRIDHAAGVILNRKVGDKVEAGEPVALMHHNAHPAAAEAMELIRSAIEVSERTPVKRPIIYDVIL